MPLPDSQQELAATLVADGRYSFQEIATQVGVDPRTIYSWRKEKAFSSRVEKLIRDLTSAAMRRGIARKDYRIKTLADLQSKMLSVMEARALNMADVPGGDTGLMVRSPIVSGGSLLGYEYAVDTALVRELRGVQEQAAKELGQLVEKHEHKVRSLKDLSDDELIALSAELTESESTEAGDLEGDRAEEEAGGASGETED